MSNKQLYIIRHGETDYNKQNMVQGSGIDAPLNETGHQQAAAFYQHYKDHPFDKVYISSLQRTRQSVHQFIEAGMPYESLPQLNEISWGNQEGQPFNESSSALYKQVIHAWAAGNLTESVGGGESPLDVMARQKVAMEYIMSQQHEKQVLICMHGRAMRILLSWLLGYDLSQMDHFMHENLCLYQLTFTGSMFRVDKHNDTAHLEKLKIK